MLPEDLSRFLREEEWFFAPDNKSIQTAAMRWCDGRRLKKNGHISAWNTSKVTDMSQLFQQSLFNDNINAWDVSNVTNMGVMFYITPFFNQPLEQWDVSNVTNMSHMFKGAVIFNQPLASWDVSKVTDMSYMFANAKSFNQPLNWKITTRTNLYNIFFEAQSLDT